MYVDDRLGRRSRARSGLDQLDVAEDLRAADDVDVEKEPLQGPSGSQAAAPGPERPRARRPKRHKPLAAVPSFRELRRPTRCE